MNLNSTKHTWTCATCGQGLTRKSSAVRHNNDLHSGRAMIVRPNAYIVGILNGKFLESDPLLYRRNHIGQKNRSSVNNRTGGPGAVGRSIAHEKMYEYAQQQPIESDSVDKLSPQFNANLNSYNEANDFKASNSMKKFSERWLKVKEFETLAKKHCRAHIAKQMMVMVNTAVAIGNDDFFATLRDIDRKN
ncbi:MAG: hypothetical protein ACJ71C_05515 [Nitrososphaeraceae archaeon]